jgi:hypothetical protein
VQSQRSLAKNPFKSVSEMRAMAEKAEQAEKAAFCGTDSSTSSSKVPPKTSPFKSTKHQQEIIRSKAPAASSPTTTSAAAKSSPFKTAKQQQMQQESKETLKPKLSEFKSSWSASSAPPTFKSSDPSQPQPQPQPQAQPQAPSPSPSPRASAPVEPKLSEFKTGWRPPTPSSTAPVPSSSSTLSKKKFLGF